MGYVQAASRSFNAARSASRNAVRLTGVGKRRTLASMHHYQCFKSEENLPSINGQKKDGMSGMAFHNFSSLTGGVLLSSSDDGDTSLNTNSMQIRFFETLEFSEEDDGG